MMGNPVPKRNIDVVRGDTYEEVFTVAPGGTAQDLTGYTVRAQIRATADAAAILATPTTVISGATDGEITLTLSAAQTAALSGDMVYDLEVTSPTSVVTTVARGAVRLHKDTTK